MAASVALVLMVSIAAFSLLMPVDIRAANEAPDWDEGDGVAAGIEIDMLSLFDEYTDIFIDNLTALLLDEGIMELEDLSIEKGSIKAFASVGVTDKSDGNVTVTQKMGFEIIFKATMSAVMLDMTEPGVYDDEYALEQADTIDISNSVSLEFKVAMVQYLSVTFDEESMDIMEISMSIRPSFMIEIDMEKLPWLDDEDESITVSYESFKMFVKADVKTTLALEFMPGLKLFDLENIETDHEWDTATENISVSLRFEGVIDMASAGKSPAVTEINGNLADMFAEIAADMPGASGLEGFPIILEEVSIPSEYFVEAADDVNGDIIEEIEPEIVNGEMLLGIIPVPMQIPLICTGKDNSSTDNSTLFHHFFQMGVMDDDSNIYWIFLRDNPDPDNITIPGDVKIPLWDLTGGWHENQTVFIGGLPYVKDLLDFDRWDSVLKDTTEATEEMIIGTVETMTGMDMEGKFSFESMEVAAANDGLGGIETTQNDIGDTETPVYEDPAEEDPPEEDPEEEDDEDICPLPFALLLIFGIAAVTMRRR